MDDAELNQLIKRKGYGIASSFPRKGAIVSQIHHAGKSPELECAAGCEPVCEEKDTLNYSGQCTLRIKFFRKRLVDPDGNSAKYQIDFLRYCGALKEDNAKSVRIVFEGQEKVASETEERTEIIVEYPEVDFSNLFVKTKA